MRIVRVGVSTNFGHTKAEYEELHRILRPGDLAFINSNAKDRIKGHLPAVVTVNPDLDKFVEPRGNIETIKAVRVKFVTWPNDRVFDAMCASVGWAEDRAIPIIFTPMRFIRSATLSKFSRGPEMYTYNRNGYMKAYDIDLKNQLREFIIGDSNVICDDLGKGCPACNACSRLTYGKNVTPYGLNLAMSLPRDRTKHCKHSCPDCWALKHFQYAGVIRTGIIYKNRKMKGKK